MAVEGKSKLRVRFVFWLDMCRDDEFDLAQYADSLKEKRLYAKTIRDGLRLIRSLRDQQLDILFALFPWIHAWLEERAEAIAQTKLNTRSSGSSGGEGEDIRSQLNRLEQLVIQQRAGIGNEIRLQELRPGEGVFETKQFQPLDFDDMDQAIEMSKVAADPQAIFNNFMQSTGALDSTPAPKKKTRKSKPELPKVPVGLPHPAVLGSAKPLAGANIQFTAPAFDD